MTVQNRLFDQFVTEREVVQGCLEFLRLHGIEAWRQNNTGVFDQKSGRYYFHGRKGVSDIIGLTPPTAPCGGGKFLAVECKRPGMCLRPAQQEFQAMIAKNDGIACCVHSVEELAQDLEEARVLDGTFSVPDSDHTPVP